MYYIKKKIKAYSVGVCRSWIYGFLDLGSDHFWFIWIHPFKCLFYIKMWNSCPWDNRMGLFVLALLFTYDLYICWEILHRRYYNEQHTIWHLDYRDIIAGKCFTVLLKMWQGLTVYRFSYLHRPASALFSTAFFFSGVQESGWQCFTSSNSNLVFGMF